MKTLTCSIYYNYNNNNYIIIIIIITKSEYRICLNFYYVQIIVNGFPISHFSLNTSISYFICLF